jgi:hypothetical protein
MTAAPTVYAQMAYHLKDFHQADTRHFKTVKILQSIGGIMIMNCFGSPPASTSNKCPIHTPEKKYRSDKFLIKIDRVYGP